MKKYFKIAFCLFVPLLAVVGLYHYYLSLPIEGAYERGPIAYPQIERVHLKQRLAQLDTEVLLKMKQSGIEVLKWHTLLNKVNATVISEVVPNSDPFFAREHYPYNEVYDKESHSLYYYHSHRPGEHGHFHLFFCDQTILNQHTPLSTWSKKNSSVHLLALSMHPDGTPLGFFTTNQWITPKEWWYSAKDIHEFITHFEIKHPYPSWPTNQWLNHMLRLFSPQIEDALKERDQRLNEANMPLEKALKAKSLDILSQVPISIEMQMDVLEELLQERQESSE